MNISEIQKKISEQKNLDGWLLYDFHAHNSIAIELLGIDPTKLLTRRFFYWIPKKGEPVKIVHQIEADALNLLPGKTVIYASWQKLEEALFSTLKGVKTVAMEHATNGEIPVLAKLDAGTYEWLSSKGIKVVSSWPIAQHFIAHWNQKQLSQHKSASKMLVDAYKSAWDLLSKKGTITEYDLQEHITDFFSAKGYITNHPPIVAVGKNSAEPHYCPSKKSSAKITSDNLLLIDLWAKKDALNAPYADITQVAYIGKKVPAAIQKLYSIVWNAQEKAISYIKNNKIITGAAVDDAARSYIDERGYASHFLHRTGHNIHTELHGSGPNIDNFETHDTRQLLEKTCYSIEPGIYLPNLYGIRLECNVYIASPQEILVTGKSPKQIPSLIKG
jgi:Xaa-Pro aminopeptidase